MTDINKLYADALSGEEISMREATRLLVAIRKEREPWYRATKAAFDRQIMATVSPLTIGVVRAWDPPKPDPTEINDTAHLSFANLT